MKRYFVFIQQYREGCGCEARGYYEDAQNEFELYKQVMDYHPETEERRIIGLWWTEAENMHLFLGEDISEYNEYLRLSKKFNSK